MRMKVLIALLSALCIAIVAVAFGATALMAVLTTHGTILWGAHASMTVSLTDIDWGTFDPVVIQNTGITKALTIQNTGNVPIRILTAIPDLATVVPSAIKTFVIASIPTTDIPAGGTVNLNLTVSFQTGGVTTYLIQNNLVGKSVPFSMSVVIATNATNP